MTPCRRLGYGRCLRLTLNILLGGLGTWTALMCAPGATHAQGLPSVAAVAAPPSRADSLLARGRLRAAEDALYAAVAAAPAAPDARGALGRYLASRGRFQVAEVLLKEALHFGADTAAVLRAIAAMAPFRPTPAQRGTTEMSPVDSAISSVPFTFSEDGRVIGRLAIRGLGGRTVMATLDPRALGVVVRGVAESPVDVRTTGGGGPRARLLAREFWIGARRFSGIEGSVDPDVPPGEVWIGLDVLIRVGFTFDERAGTLTVGREGPREPAPRSRIPFVLGFPGLALVPQPGVAQISIESTRARSLLRGRRWWLEIEHGTLIVE